MFGKRSAVPDTTSSRSQPEQAAPRTPEAAEPDQRMQRVRVAIFRDLIDSVDLTELGRHDPTSLREEISDIVAEIINVRNIVLSAAEQQQMIAEICNDVLGL